MAREIKFRAWLKNHEEPRMMFFDLREEELNVRYLIDKGSPIMQYTGLKDKNGREIYEWDIVKTFNPLTGVVAPPRLIEWNSFTARFNGLVRGDVREIEVIGNIYENPGLLASPTEHSSDKTK